MLLDIAVRNVPISKLKVIREESTYGGRLSISFTRALNNSTEKLFSGNCYKFHKVTYAVPRIRQAPKKSMIICVRREKNATRKVNWERHGCLLACKLSLPESNQQHIFPISCFIFHQLPPGAGMDIVISNFTDGT